MPADAMDYEKVNQALVSKDTNALKGILLENGIDINATFDGGPQFGKTALHLCCEGSLTESAQLLIQHGASVNVVDKWNQTPLMYGVCANSPAIVNLLLESRCELNHTDRFHKTALHYAISNDSADIVESLLKAKCEVNVRDSKGCTPVWLAASMDGRSAHLKLLLAAGADVSLADTQDQRTPLQAAIMHTKVDTVEYVRLLVEAKSPLNTFDHFGHSVLMSVIRRSWQDGETVQDTDLQLVKLLLDAGHDVNSKHASQNWSHYGGTALMMAVERGAPSLVKLFLDAKANPDIQDEKGCTALHVAAQLNYVDIGKLLVDGGCRVDIVGEVELDDEDDEAPPAAPPGGPAAAAAQKMTAAECARRLGNTAFVDMLAAAKPKN